LGASDPVVVLRPGDLWAVLYYKFAEQKTLDWIPAGHHYNDGLFRRASDYQAFTNSTATY